MGYNNDGPLIGGDTYFGNQNSYTKIDNQGVITQYGVAHVVANYETVNDIQFDPNIVTPDYSEALMYYDSTEKTLNYYTDVQGTSINIGQENVVKVRNSTGAKILNGQLVYVLGATGNRPNVTLAKADAESTSSKTLGMATNDIDNNKDGYITTFGLVRDLNTQGLVAGNMVWLSATTAGGWTTTRPTSPNHAVFIGYITTVNPAIGEVFVNIQNGYELDELHDVLITAPATNDVLQYNATSTVWENVTNPTLTTAKIGNVAGGNYTEFEADGTMVAVGTATCYKDINLSGASLTPSGATAPDQINMQNANLIIYGFDGSSLTERLYGSMEMQHDYKEGSDIEVHIHWCPTTVVAGNVVWQMYISWANSGDVIPAGTLYTATASPTGGVAWKNNYTMVTTLSGVGKTINSQLIIQLFRDPTNVGDTYVADAGLIQIGIHYQVDTLGSRTETHK